MDDRNPRGLANLLKSPEDKGSRTSSNAASKKSNDLVEENIDSQILSILGLEDVFDLTYEEYASLLKEAAVKGRMTNSQMTTESVELVTNELKRVRGKTGRFKVKQKKVNIDKVLNRKAPSPTSAIVKSQKLLPPTLEEEQKDGVEIKSLQGEVQTGITNILTSLVSIKSILQGQNKADQETAKNERKKVEKSKKKDREDALEKKKGGEFKLPKAISAPVDSFFESIKNYFKNILLGSVVLGLYKWLKDPANEKTINDFGNFLTNNAPLILGGLLAIAALPIASTLLGLSAAVLGGVATLAKALAFLATPAGLFALTTYLAREGLYKFALPQLTEGMNKAIEFGYKKDYGEGSAAKGKFITKLRDQYGRIAPKAEFEKMTSEEKTTANFLQMYDDELKNRQKINNELYELNRDMKAMPQQEWRYKPQIKQKENELKESDKKLNQMESQISIGGKSFSELQKQFEEKGESALPQTSLSKRLYPGQTLKSKPQTSKIPKMPGLPASAAEIGTGPAGNRVGSNMATFGETGNVSNAPGFVHGHFQTDTGTANDLVNDTAPIVKGLIDSGVTPELSKGQKFTPGMTMEEIKKLIRLGITQHSHSGDGRSVDIFVPKGTKVPFGLSDVRNTGGRGGITGILPGSGKVWVGHLAPGSKSGGVHVPIGEMGQLAQTKPPTPSISSPTGRSNIVPLPIPMGGQQASQSNSAALQTSVPSFSSEDPNNMTTLVVRAIYNVVG